MEFSGIDNVSGVIFESPFDRHHGYYVFDKQQDYDKVEDKGFSETLRAQGLELDDAGSHFYLLHTGGCMCPLITIVRADTVLDAYEIFADNFSDSDLLDDETLKDYQNDDFDTSGEYDDCVGWNSDGKPYDSETIEGGEITGRIVICRG